MNSNHNSNLSCLEGYVIIILRVKMNRRKRDDGLYQAIGLKIEKLRNKRKLTQESLAETCGLTRTSIVHIERGRQKLPIDRLYSIAEALQVTVFDLLPLSKPAASIDPVSIDTISDKARQEVENILNKRKG